VIPIFVAAFDGVLLLDLAGIAEPFRLANVWAANQRMPAPFDVRFVGPKSTARTSLGISLGGLAELPSAIDPAAWIVVPGATRATNHAGTAARALVPWMRRVGPAAARRITVCSGALLAGRAGWLDGRECTTHHDLIEALRDAAPAAKVIENRIFVADGALATSAGITAGIDLALWVIGEVVGPIGALAVARDMVMFARRTGADPQVSSWLVHRNHLHPAIHRVQDAIAQAPAERWSVSRMASAAHVGERHLTRLFQAHAGVTPLVYLQRIRLAVARSLLSDPGASVESAAAAAGFTSAHQLRRAWRRDAGTTPRGGVAITR